MHKINKDDIQKFIFSLRNSDGGFYLQKNFKQSSLMSSAFSIMTLELINSMDLLENKKEGELFLKHQDEKTGLFVDPSLKIEYEKIEDIELNYIHYQTTAFSLSALDALKLSPVYNLSFMDAFRGKEKISKFFENINWKNPWHESNKIMFLLQFFSYEHIKLKNQNSFDNINIIIDKLNSFQDPRTGLWGTQHKASTFVSMAAAYHFLIYYKYYNREINHSEKISTSVFQLQMRDGLFHPFGGGGACEDLDAIDVISKVSSELSVDSERSLKDAYSALLKNYDRSGGFCWAKRPKLPFFLGLKYFNPSSELFNTGMIKWIIKNNYVGSLFPFVKEDKIYKYSNWNQMKFHINYSDSWSTWFRLLSIATLERLLPNLKKHDIDFKFRSLPSIGWLESE